MSKQRCILENYELKFTPRESEYYAPPICICDKCFAELMKREEE